MKYNVGLTVEVENQSTGKPTKAAMTLDVDTPNEEAETKEVQDLAFEKAEKILQKHNVKVRRIIWEYREAAEVAQVRACESESIQ